MKYGGICHPDNLSFSVYCTPVHVVIRLALPSILCCHRVAHNYVPVERGYLPVFVVIPLLTGGHHHHNLLSLVLLIVKSREGKIHTVRTGHSGQSREGKIHTIKTGHSGQSREGKIHTIRTDHSGQSREGKIHTIRTGAWSGYLTET